MEWVVPMALAMSDRCWVVLSGDAMRAGSAWPGCVSGAGRRGVL